MGHKVKPGDGSLPSGEFNRHVDASDAYHDAKARGETRGGRWGSSDTNIVKVKNSSGAARSRGQILEFTGFALTDLAERKLWFTGGSPTLANGFGVLLNPLPENDLDDCQVAGVCVALVNVIDADDRYARPVAGNYVLQSVAIGPVRIIYKPSGTGEMECAVHLLGVAGEILVKNQSGGDYSANGGPHDYHVYIGTPGGLTDTGQILSAYNIPAFKTGKMGAASLLEGVAYAAPWEN